MKNSSILILLFLFTPFSKTWASSTSKLRSGDVLLQAIGCWSCSLIEEQENSEYAHSAIYLRINNEDYVVEALGEVRIIKFSEFFKRTKKGSHVRALRLKSLPINFEQKLIGVLSDFLKLPFDHQFLWDNKINGKEALYCSELIYKSFAEFVSFSDFKPKVMLFDVNPKLWDNYYKGSAPRGKIGISPEDFNKSDDFEWITDINN